MNDISNQDGLRDMLRALSSQDFLKVGMNEIAYVRPVQLSNHKSAFGVYAADGTQLSLLDSMDMAVATLRHNDLIPVTLH